MKVRVIYEGETASFDGLSKLSRINDLRKLIRDKWDDLAPNLQRLLHRGKQLEDGNTLHDYRFGMDDVVHCMKRRPLSELGSSASNVSLKEERPESPLPKEKKAEREEAASKWFLQEDFVDVAESNGSWYEGRIDGIFRMSPEDSFESADGLAYKVIYSGYEEDEPSYVGLDSLRPRSLKKIPPSLCEEGQKILATFNVDKPSKRGLWYDCIVQKKDLDSKPRLIATVMLNNNVPLKDKKLLFLDELYLIEENVSSEGRKPFSDNVLRTPPPACDTCDDGPKFCQDCSCSVCRKKDRADKALMCDDCNSVYHLDCLDPPLEAIPDEDWYCPDCKMPDDIVVKAGFNPLLKRKTKNVPAYNPKSKRDWGKGYATASRTKECTKVAKNHFGPIPGVEVGMSWLYRIQLSEEGIHRPPVAGISGSPKDGGATSIVLSGGYDEDEDNGDTFWYTGAGGRDLSGNKRTGTQSFDQVLTKTNLSIAMSCAVSVDDINGGNSGDKWRNGKPVRVVRSYKLKKHSKYAPDEGLRYDGIYKVVKYCPEKGKAGFIVWRYFFRRDDASPAPWTEEGKMNTLKNGFKCIYPEGYTKPEDNKGSKKRKRAEENEDSQPPAKAKSLKTVFTIDNEVLGLISEDKVNESLWCEIRKNNYANRLEFLNKIEEDFACICCQDIVCFPVTTPCNHNVCMSCIKRSFACKIYNCPSCRNELSEEFDIQVNNNLRSALQTLFPGYETGR